MIAGIKSVRDGVLLCGVVLFFSGCVVAPKLDMQQETGTPIKAENIGRLVKGKTTKLEVIELFGMPSAAGAGMPGMPNMSGMPGMGGSTLPGAIIVSGSDEIYIYKHCKIGEPGGGLQMVTVFSKIKVEQEEKCEQLSVLLNKNEVVKAFSYIADDPVDEITTSKLTKGKSNKTDVIELFGAPSSINVSGNDEIYTFKKCVMTGEASAFGGKKSGQNCKQLTVMLDKNNEVVKTYSFQPYQQ